MAGCSTRVLIIAYHFPPDAEIGAVRPYQFARLLPEHGIDAWVLTVSPEHAERYDAGCVADGIPADRVIRTQVRRSRLEQAAALKAAVRGKHPKAVATGSSGARDMVAHGTPPSIGKKRVLAWLAYPDWQAAGWRQPALAAAEAAHARIGFHAVVSTSPPRTAHLVARELTRRHGIPWVMDLRDPWISDWDQGTMCDPVLRRLQRSLFQSCLRTATTVVCNTDRLRGEVEVNVPGLAVKTVTIPNGYAGPVSAADDHGTVPARFEIGYFGFLMGERSAVPFLEGLRLWRDRVQPEAADARVRFVGSVDGEPAAEAQRAVQRLHLGDLVSFEPPVPRSEVGGLLRESYVLLLLANNQPLQIPGKLYEYLGASRRILAFTEPDSATADMVRDRPGCRVAGSSEQVADALSRDWTEYREGRPAAVDHSAFLKECSYRERTASLARVLAAATRR